MYHSSMSALRADQEKPSKKIIPSSKIKGIREEYKKTFLPLLIDVFELRQMIQTYKKKKDPLIFSPLNKPKKSPQEILNRLTQLQQDIKESKRWCEGVILQIEKGIEETREALQLIENPQKNLSSNQEGLAKPPKKPNRKSFWEKIFKRK